MNKESGNPESINDTFQEARYESSEAQTQDYPSTPVSPAEATVTQASIPEKKSNKLKKSIALGVAVLSVAGGIFAIGKNTADARSNGSVSAEPVPGTSTETPSSATPSASETSATPAVDEAAAAKKAREDEIVAKLLAQEKAREEAIEKAKQDKVDKEIYLRNLIATPKFLELREKIRNGQPIEGMTEADWSDFMVDDALLSLLSDQAAENGGTQAAIEQEDVRNAGIGSLDVHSRAEEIISGYLWAMIHAVNRQGEGQDSAMAAREAEKLNEILSGKAGDPSGKSIQNVSDYMRVVIGKSKGLIWTDIAPKSLKDVRSTLPTIDDKGDVVVKITATFIEEDGTGKKFLATFEFHEFTSEQREKIEAVTGEKLRPKAGYWTIVSDKESRLYKVSGAF